LERLRDAMRDQRVLVKPKHARLIYELHKTVNTQNIKVPLWPLPPMSIYGNI